MLGTASSGMESKAPMIPNSVDTAWIINYCSVSSSAWGINGVACDGMRMGRTGRLIGLSRADGEGLVGLCLAEWDRRPHWFVSPRRRHEGEWRWRCRFPSCDNARMLMYLWLTTISPTQCRAQLYTSLHPIYDRKDRSTFIAIDSSP